MNALSKAMIVETLCAEVGLSKANAKELIELFFETLKETLESGEGVKLSGFGNFELRDKSERPGRNPKTGKAVTVLPRRVVTFRSGLKFRTEIDQRSH